MRVKYGFLVKISYSIGFSVKSSNWASKVIPTLGCSIEILHDIYIYIYIHICSYFGFSKFAYEKPIQNICMPKCVGGITWSRQVHAQSQFCELETKCSL